MAVTKTNVMRILDSEGVQYRYYSYEIRDGMVDAVSVAKKLQQPEEKVYKTLVTKGAGGDYFVFLLASHDDLDLKAAARAAGEKSIAMIPPRDLNKVTGYIRGGCSPIGMKKKFATILDSSCLALETIIVSAGKIGCQVEVSPKDLMKLVDARTAPVSVKTGIETEAVG